MLFVLHTVDLACFSRSTLHVVSVVSGLLHSWTEGPASFIRKPAELKDSLLVLFTLSF